MLGPILSPILGSGNTCENTDKAPPDFICNKDTGFINKSAIKRINEMDTVYSCLYLFVYLFIYLLWLFSIFGVLQEPED